MRLRILLLPLLLLAPAAAQHRIDGIVQNATTGRPAAGNEVVLQTLTGNMEEAARVQSDARGRFTLNAPDAEAGYLVRVTHQGVNYFRPAPPGTGSVEVMVYDAAPRVEGLSLIANVVRIQAEGGTMRVTEAFAVRNASQPPRTLAGDRTLEFYLPPGAQIQSSMAAGPGGMPVASAPVPQDEAGRYAYLFPIRPGETRFQIDYSLPYAGSATFEPRLLLPSDHMVVVLPKTMQFQSRAPEGTFQQLSDEPDSNLHMAANVVPGQPVSFSVSGTGIIPVEGEGGPRPGGGLGPPSAEPGPLETYKWYLLGGLALLLVVGAWFALRKPPATASAPASAGWQSEGMAAAAPPSAALARDGRSSLLMEALKEELFQLEVDRQSGAISAEEYQRARQALDLTIQRAVSRAREQV
jgi:hypothetical protein